MLHAEFVSFVPTATKRPNCGDHATPYQEVPSKFSGVIAGYQFLPSVLHAEFLPNIPTATKRPNCGDHATPNQPVVSKFSGVIAGYQLLPELFAEGKARTFDIVPLVKL